MVMKRVAFREAAGRSTFTDLVGNGLTGRSALLSNGMPVESIRHARFGSRNAAVDNSVARSGPGSGRLTAAAVAGGRVTRSLTFSGGRGVSLARAICGPAESVL